MCRPTRRGLRGPCRRACGFAGRAAAAAPARPGLRLAGSVAVRLVERTITTLLTACCGSRGNAADIRSSAWSDCGLFDAVALVVNPVSMNINAAIEPTSTTPHTASVRPGCRLHAWATEVVENLITLPTLGTDHPSDRSCPVLSCPAGGEHQRVQPRRRPLDRRPTARALGQGERSRNSGPQRPVPSWSPRLLTRPALDTAVSTHRGRRPGAAAAGLGCRCTGWCVAAGGRAAAGKPRC